MDAVRTLALLTLPSLILAAQGLTPDPWQRDLLLGSDRQVLLKLHPRRRQGSHRRPRHAFSPLSP